MSPLRGPAWNRSHSCGRTRVPTYDAAFLPFSPGTCSAAVFCQVPSFSSSSVPYSQETVPHALRSTNPYPGLWSPLAGALPPQILHPANLCDSPQATAGRPVRSSGLTLGSITPPSTRNAYFIFHSLLCRSKSHPPTLTAPTLPKNRYSHPLPPEVMWQTKNP